MAVANVSSGVRANRGGQGGGATHTDSTLSFQFPQPLHFHFSVRDVKPVSPMESDLKTLRRPPPSTNTHSPTALSHPGRLPRWLGGQIEHVRAFSFQLVWLLMRPRDPCSDCSPLLPTFLPPPLFRRFHDFIINNKALSWGSLLSPSPRCLLFPHLCLPPLGAIIKMAAT